MAALERLHEDPDMFALVPRLGSPFPRRRLEAVPESVLCAVLARAAARRLSGLLPPGGEESAPSSISWPASVAAEQLVQPLPGHVRVRTASPGVRIAVGGIG